MNIDQYINDGQDPKVVEKLLLKLQDMLASAGEDVIYIAVQKMPAVTLFPDSIVLTDRRIFVCRSTKLGLATAFEIFALADIRNITFKEGLMGAKVAMLPVGAEHLEIGHIPKSQARKFYQLGMEALEKQKLEKQNLEKQVEEKPLATVGPAVEQDDELTLKLKKLKSLFERQLITQEEYENKKNELLSQL